MAVATTSPSREKSTDKVAPISVRIDGQQLDPKVGNKVVEAVVKKSRLLPDSAYVLLSDPERRLVGGSLGRLGQTLEVLVGGPAAAAPKPLFNGVITALQPEFRRDGVLMGLRAYDRSHQMTTGLHTRTYQNQTATDILKKVLASYGLQPKLDATRTVYPYLLQSQESDWDFVWRLARREGFCFFVDGGTAYFRPVDERTGTGPTFSYGGGATGGRMFSFTPTISTANLPATVSATYRDQAGNEYTASIETSAGQISLTGESPVSYDRTFGALKGSNDLQLKDLVVVDQKELTAAVEAARDRVLASSVEADATVEGNPDVKPGVAVQLRDLGNGYDGDYVVSGCTHVYRGAAGYTTRFSSSVRSRTLLAAVNASEPAGAKDGFGTRLVRGVVTNNKDPDDRGRVRVKFPSAQTESEAAEGWWAPVLTASSGKDRGMLMLPQVGDEVLVGFENGDTRRAFVLGSMWDGKGAPGKEVLQHDGSFAVASDQRVLIKAKSDFEFATDKAWTAKAQKGITFDSPGGGVTFKSGKEIVIKAPTIKLEADMKLEIKSAQIAVNGTATLELKAPSITIGGGNVKLG